MLMKLVKIDRLADLIEKLRKKLNEQAGTRFKQTQNNT